MRVVPIKARYAGRDRVLCVVQMNARCGGCESMPVWSADAVGNPNDGDRSAEHADAADRFAREIVGFLIGSPVARSRRLIGRPLDGSNHTYRVTQN